MKQALRILLLLAWLLAGPLDASDRRLVLITGAASTIDSLDAIEVRKLFLGLPVMRGGALLHPLCNASDAQIREAFLQYVVAMSQSAYDRRILSQINKQGGPRPPEVTSVSAVIERLAKDPQAVSYAWSADVAGNPQIRILREL